MKKVSKLILMRHGQSVWNKLNLFTGWVDIPLSQEGIDEALRAGEKIKDIPIDIIFVSALVRSQMTAFLAMLNHSSKKVPVLLHAGEGKMDEWGKIYSQEGKESTVPVIASWHLNERMYGALQGLNKAETAKKYGAEQVQIWRRSFEVAPPEGESLEMTAKRTIPYFVDTILPKLAEGKNVFISAHGNSLRAVVMYLEKLSSKEVVKLELATGEPMIYEYADGACQKSN